MRRQRLDPPLGQKELGTRAELKNINSFRFIKQAIEYEIDRQAELIGDGGTVVQETRLFDSNSGVSRSMRSKEEAHDYRYFPDPDLVPLVIDATWIETTRQSLPELPENKFKRYTEQFGLKEYDAGVLIAEKAVAKYFEACVALLGDAKACANWITGELARRLKDNSLTIADSPVTPTMLVGLLKRVADNTISGNIAKKVFETMWQSGQEADLIIEEQGLKQVTDSGAIEKLSTR